MTTMRLTALNYAGEGITLFEFRPVDGGDVSVFDAGAHVDLFLARGLVRQYSLANDPRERHRYVLGVKKEAAGRGGSAYMHEQLRLGTLLEVGAPRNNFPLDEKAPHSIFVAGGIGITPIRSMIHRAEALGRSWELHYAARTLQDAVFADTWSGDRRVHLHVNSEHGGSPPDLAAVGARARQDAHAYCCGPAPMIEAFGLAFAHLPAGQRHVERFGAAPVDTSASGAFSVVLSRSGRTLEVPADRSILTVLREAGIAAAASCEQGICGACEVRVLQGEPEHRDLLLSPDEQANGGTMMICCSRSRSPELVLDL